MKTADARDLDSLRYPVGRFTRPKTLTAADRARAIVVLEAFPAQLRTAVDGRGEAALNTPYRDGGWTVRQVVHHVADSHLNAYARMRLALTEDWPTITPYNEAAWAELSDARTMPIEASLAIIDGLHARWVQLLRDVAEPDWSGRGYRHPESGDQTVEQVLALYEWHSRHHLHHVTNALAA